MSNLKFTLAITALFTSVAIAVPPVSANEHVIKMLNVGKDGSMVFEPAYVNTVVGDTVTFVPADKAAHNSASLVVPTGAKTWKGEPDQEVKIKMEKEGVYLYACEPHKIMGMVGVIQVGKPVNLADAKAVASKEQATFMMGKDRFDKALAQVK